jgi:uncharacterized protein (TIGR00730 family)
MARDLGVILAKNEVECIYGAGNQGLMGELADSVLKYGGRVKGVIPQFMHDEGWGHDSLTDLHIVESMHQRKMLMASLSGAAIALPGGCGTLEELLEIITWKQLGLYKNPIVIVNVNGYYNDLIAMLNKAIDENFMRPQHLAMWVVVESVDEVLPAIRQSAEWSDRPLDLAVI